MQLVSLYYFVIKVAEHSFAHVLTNSIQCIHKECKKKNAVTDKWIPLFARCQHYLNYFSSQLNAMYWQFVSY